MADVLRAPNQLLTSLMSPTWRTYCFPGTDPNPCNLHEEKEEKKSSHCRMWLGLQTITDYKEKHRRELPSDTSLPDELNYFYARLEAINTEICMRAPAVPDNCVITLSTADVSNNFKQVNIHKAAGPDGLPGCVLRECADQLASVFTDILNLCLSESVIPTCFKQTTIVPVSKNTKVTCLNNYRPVAQVHWKAGHGSHQQNYPRNARSTLICIPA